MNWKQWTGIGISSAAVITEIVLCFTNPMAAVCGGVGFVLGAVASYVFFANKNK